MQWDYWRLLTVISLAGFVGLLFGQMIPFMFVAVLLYALWLQHNWYKLWHWLQKPKKNEPPIADGIVDNVCREIQRLRKQNSNRKKKLSNYLKQFQSTTAALPDAIVVLGEYGQVDWANHSARDLLNIHWPKDNLVRANNLIRDPAFQQLLDDPETHNYTAVLHSPHDPNLQLEIKLVYYSGRGRLLIARDITQTVKLQRMRRDFVANVSHELRTPLTVLRGYLESIDEESPPEIWQTALPAMRQQTERMHLMIKDLLALSRLETGEKTLRQLPTDVPQLLTSIIEDAYCLEHYRGQHIESRIDSDKWLLADVDELRSAISNLLFNAVKYTPEHSMIIVNWRVDDNGGYIEVTDNGEGIAEHHLDRLTERFYRVDKGRAQDAGGTGLGLAIVKHVLQRHSAQLKIESVLGEGSSFTCYFPSSKVIDKIDI